MDVMILWDFSPGLAVAAQVRRWFNSQVHFSSSLATKEFSLVACFSFSSFPLSKESVSIALQCCLGGNASGFRVTKLSDKRFKFSVASNKVGHFIYSLRDRSWPDFHCSFSLFCGDGYAPCFFPLDQLLAAFEWSSSCKNRSGSVDSMEPCKSKIVPSSNSLNSLKASAYDGTSAMELSKFDLKFHRSIAGALDQQSSSPNSVVSSPKLPTTHILRVGAVNCSFSDSDIIQGGLNDNFSSRAFLGHNFRMVNYWSDRLINDPKFMTFKLECVRDLRQVGQSEFEIQRALGL
jgi:hypothetical protein